MNLLIAMMSETYEKIKQNADNEWKYSRVFVVDEFVSSVYWIPPPFSLPFLVVEMLSGVSRIACSNSSLKAAQNYSSTRLLDYYAVLLPRPVRRAISWLKVAQIICEGTASWPTTANLKALLAPAQSGAPPLKFGGLVRRQQACLNPSST